MAKETQNNGFIKLHRSIIDWQHWGEPNVVVVFLTLLLMANHKRGWWQGLRCERGETFITLETLCEYTKLSKPTIIRILRLLEDSGEITRKRLDQKHTKTIIRKYNDYQDFNLFSGKTNLPQTLPQTLLQTLPKQEREERKEIKRVENINAHTHEEILQSWLDSKITAESFCKNEGITLNQFEQLGKAVINEWAMTGETGRNATDTRKKLLAHIRAKAQAMKDRGLFVGADSKDKRLKPLIEDCLALLDEGFSRDDVSRFYAYWTEKLTDGTDRFRFEAQTAWTTKTRFINFLKLKKQ